MLNKSTAIFCFCDRGEVWRGKPVSFSTRPSCGAKRWCVSETAPSSYRPVGRSCPMWAEWRASGSPGAPPWWSGSSGSTIRRRLAWGSDTATARWGPERAIFLMLCSKWSTTLLFFFLFLDPKWLNFLRVHTIVVGLAFYLKVKYNFSRSLDTEKWKKQWLNR